jgi:hypothetical protein
MLFAQHQVRGKQKTKKNPSSRLLRKMRNPARQLIDEGYQITVRIFTYTYKYSIVERKADSQGIKEVAR